MSDLLLQFDITVFKFINQTLSNHFFDIFFPLLTDLDESKIFKITLAIILSGLFIWKFKRTGVTYFLFLVLTLSVSDFVGGQVKKAVERPRPFQLVEQTSAIQRAEGKKNRSFYSNHSSNTFAVATYVSAFFPPVAPYLFTAASVVAITRVYCGVHFPSDILMGALMGILWGLIISRLVKKLIALKQQAINEN